MGFNCENVCLLDCFGKNCVYKCSCVFLLFFGCYLFNGICWCKLGVIGLCCIVFCFFGLWGVNCL